MPELVSQVTAPQGGRFRYPPPWQYSGTTMRLVLDLKNRSSGDSRLRGLIRTVIVGCFLFLAFSTFGLVLISFVLSS